MAHAQASETTLLLRAWAEGDPDALEQLTPRVYAELPRIAGYCMQNERPGRTLQTTALVHEAYLRLIDVNNVNWEHRAHFFAVSAQIIRLRHRIRKFDAAIAFGAGDWFEREFFGSAKSLSAFSTRLMDHFTVEKSAFLGRFIDYKTTSCRFA
jgi:hypothetical protein